MARTAKKFARKVLSNVDSDDSRFWCNDGTTLSNVHDLKAALMKMSNEAYKYHVNGERNDFSNWTSNVIQDPKLAKDLSRSRNREIAARKVSDRIVFLQLKLGVGP